MRSPTLIILSFAVMGLLTAPNADARVYRCTDADGNVGYSQIPCPPDQKAAEMRGVGAGAKQDKDLCRNARQLAIHTFSELRRGIEPGDVMDSFGGVNYITPATLSVINFAASLRYNEDVSPQRVGSLSFARCREGGFGELSLGDLPEFDAEGLPIAVSADAAPAPLASPPAPVAAD